MLGRGTLLRIATETARTLNLLTDTRDFLPTSIQALVAKLSPNDMLHANGSWNYDGNASLYSPLTFSAYRPASCLHLLFREAPLELTASLYRVVNFGGPIVRAVSMTWKTQTVKMFLDGSVAPGKNGHYLPLILDTAYFLHDEPELVAMLQEQQFEAVVTIHERDFIQDILNEIREPKLLILAEAKT